jgi:hypothetical protein
MPVVAVTVTAGGKAAKVKFFSETAAEMAIFRVVDRPIPDFPGLDDCFTIEGHLQPRRVS